MTTQTAALTLQKWGNSLALRIPVAIARSAHFHVGSPVELAVHADTVIVKLSGEPQLTLKERLALFDPEKHGGEVMASGRIGLEKF